MFSSGGSSHSADYCQGVIYENGTQKWLLTQGTGYLTLSDGKYHYYLQDHLANNRRVVSQTGQVEETNHYYPFGGTFAATGNVQPYKYNGKEPDTRKALNLYDYGARWYDPALGRFTTIDPLAEKAFHMSPYAYCGNNPIVRIDPTGKFGETVWDLISLGLGIKSLKDNIKKGNPGAAVIDGLGVLLDASAAALPFVPGGAGAGIKAARAADKAAEAVDATKATRDVKNGFKIEIPTENKIDRNLLNPPSRPGNAPTSKLDNKPIEIHHVGQNPEGPFKEMHWQDHRGKGSYRKNHPDVEIPSRINRAEFNKAKKEYWKKEYGQ